MTGTGRIAGDLDRIGRPVGRADPMIAAIAIDQRLDLATGNIAHYQRIQQLGYPLNAATWQFWANRFRHPGFATTCCRGPVRFRGFAIGFAALPHSGAGLSSCLSSRPNSTWQPNNQAVTGH